jgi:hypothetical protein
MSNEQFVNGIVLDHGELPKTGKRVAAVQWGDGCLTAESTAFEIGTTLRSKVIPMSDGKHLHDVVGQVVPANKKPAYLVNAQRDLETRGVQTSAPAASEFEFNLSPQEAAELQAVMAGRDDRDEPIASGAPPINPFSAGFAQPAPQQAGPRKAK